jgi:uncharacterized protein YukE
MANETESVKSGISGSVTFKVNTEDLNAKAAEVTAIITKVEREFEEVGNIVSKTKGYWIGDAGEDTRKQYLKEKELFENAIRRLKENPRDLQKIAAKYAGVEMQVEELINELPNDVIV